MLKNQKGITMSLLVVTIIVLSILLGVTLTVSTDLLSDTKIKSLISEMYMVRGKVESMNETLDFEGYWEISDETEKSNILTSLGYTSLIGTPDTPSSNMVDMPTGDKGNPEYVDSNSRWYKWDSQTLANNGFDSTMLKDGALYYVDYNSGEIIYSKGFTYKTTSGATETAYSLTKMLTVK